MTDVVTVPTPPYGPWKTTKSYLAKLKSTVIPPVIDTSVMQGLSGSAKSELRTAFRFLGLIEDDGRVRQPLRDLVAAYSTDQWKAVLGDVLADAYLGVTKNVDLDAATLNQLNDAFRTNGKADGSVLKKAVRFYLSALEDAGVTFSPHFKIRGSSTSANGATKRKPRAGTKGAARSVEDEDEEEEIELDETVTRRFRLPLPSGTNALLILPDAMDAADWSIIDTYIKSYYKLGKKS